jgi:hypothetical protein
MSPSVPRGVSTCPIAITSYPRNCIAINYSAKSDITIYLDFKIGGQVIRTVKYAYDLVLLAREEKVLPGMIDRLKLEGAIEWK